MAENDQSGTVEQFTRELGRALEPVVTAAENGPDGIKTFLENAGFEEAFADGEAQKITSALETHVAEPAAVLGKTVLAENPSFENPEEIVDAVASIFEGIKKLDDIQVSHPDVDQLGLLFLDHLLVTYLDTYHGTAYNVLSLFGVIVDSDGPGAGDIDLSGIGTMLSDPNEIPSKVFNWANDQEDFLGALVLYYLRGLCWQIGLPASLERATPEHVKQITGVNDITNLGVSGPADLDPQLKIPILSYTDQGTDVILGVKIVVLPGKNPKLPGLGVVPFGKASTEQEWELGGGWTFNVETSGDVGGLGVGAQPTTSGELETKVVDITGGDAPAEVHGEATVALSGSGGGQQNGDSSKPVLLGQPGQTRLVLNSIGTTGTIDYAKELEFGVELPSSASLVIQPSGGFLSKVLPEQMALDFDTTAGWSNLEGLYFEGGASLEAAIPTHVEIGPIALQELYLALKASPGSGGGSGGGGGGGSGGPPLTLQTAASPKLSIGPLTANVKRMGVSADVSFPENQDGNLGPVDMDVGFKPPDGLGLSLEAGAVSGGGYMEFEPEKHRYAGTFNLTFNDYSVTVVGLLKTELPGGQDGFSLLLLVTGELPPIQLGFGFTLNGIGGLVGVHRDMRSKPLGDAVRSGNIDSVLFPENVVANATQIISDLRSIFPPTTDVFVVGPMAKFGWGTPTLIEMDVGVVLAIPRWKIAILGNISMVLPDEELALVDLNLAVVGILDIPGKKLSIDASLYDSKIVMFDVSGDMAMRSSWGDQSRFMLSVGGFHPKYEPPKSFPDLRRVKASLANTGGNPKLTLTAYLAVTPNTFQVGAGVKLHAEAGPASVDGELSFDALFRFNPFEFVVDFYAKLMVAIKRFELGIEVDGTLSGPKPWRIKGKVRIDILFVSVTVHVDVSIGSKPDKQKLPSAKVLPEVERALGQTPNWDAQRPEGQSVPVSLRDPTTGDDGGSSGTNGGGAAGQQSKTVLVHPLGTIRVRQSVAPLDISMEKYGNAKPVNGRLSVVSLSMVDSQGNEVQSLPKAGELREKFAPAKFKRMSDSEKLDSQAFEKLKAGRVVTNDLVHYTGQVEEGDSDAEKRRKRRLVKAATLSFESSVIDKNDGNYRLTPEDKPGWDSDDKVNVHDSHRLANTAAVATSAARTSGSAKFKNRAETTRDQPSLSVSETRYVVVAADDLTRVDMSNFSRADNPTDGQTQVEAREARDAYTAANPDAGVTVVAAHEVRATSGGN